jgi:hypothetical protein
MAATPIRTRVVISDSSDGVSSKPLTDALIADDFDRGFDRGHARSPTTVRPIMVMSRAHFKRRDREVLNARHCRAMAQVGSSSRELSREAQPPFRCDSGGAGDADVRSESGVNPRKGTPPITPEQPPATRPLPAHSVGGVPDRWRRVARARATRRVRWTRDAGRLDTGQARS